MQVDAAARNLQITDDIREYIEKKIAKLDRFLSRIDDVHAVLEESRHRYSVELTLQARRAVFHAQATTGDVFASIDEAVDKLEMQIRRYKERIKDRRHRLPQREVASKLAETHARAKESAEEEEEADEAPLQIERADDHLANKPMTVEEAAMQLSLTPEHNFLAFLNAETEEVNVVYRATEKTYKWIEPEW